MTERTWKILKLDWKTPGIFFFSSKRVGTVLKGMASLLLGGIDDLCVRNLGCSSVLFALCCVFCMWMLVAMQLSCDVVR